MTELAENNLSDTDVATPRVLVVDDHDLIRDIVVSVVRLAGYDVVEASTGEQALELAGSETFALILLDLSLPKLSGKELMDALTERCPDARVLLMSGQDEVTIGRLARDFGAAGFFCKPFTPEDLVKKMKELVDA